MPLLDHYMRANCGACALLVMNMPLRSASRGGTSVLLSGPWIHVTNDSMHQARPWWIFFSFFFIFSRFICLLLCYHWFFYNTSVPELSHDVSPACCRSVGPCNGWRIKNISFKSGQFLKYVFLQEACLVCFCFARTCVFKEYPPLPESIMILFCYISSSGWTQDDLEDGFDRLPKAMNIHIL